MTSTDDYDESAGQTGDMISDQLQATNKIATEARRRQLGYEVVSVPKAQREEYETAGWSVERELKTRFRMRREKSHGRAFKDRVWTTFARLQFGELNGGAALELNYGENPMKTRQFDVFAADDEVVLLITCKSTDEIRPGRFASETEFMSSQRSALLARVRTEYPDHKVMFLLATNNYTLSKSVARKVDEAGYFHVSEDTIDYYLMLAEHLGVAARFSFSVRCSPVPRSRIWSRL